MMALGIGAGGLAWGAKADPTLPTRSFGKTGRTLPLIGLDGRAISHGPEEKTGQMIAAAIAAGMTFFDTSMNHMDGRSERRYGKFLASNDRDRIFIQSRTMSRTKPVAATNVDLALARLNMDYLDSFLMDSAITSPVDDQIETPNPDVFEAFIAARQAGKVRNIGVRAEADTALVQRLLDQYGAEIDLVMLPFALPESDEAIVKARKLGVGIIADVDKNTQKKWTPTNDGPFKFPDYITSWILSFNRPKDVNTFTKRARGLAEKSA